VKSGLEPAILYNDQSVLENMHISKAWAVFTAPEHNCVASMEPQERVQLRETMVALVLGTDMAGHFDELAKFMTKTSSNSFAAESPENTRTVLKMALHCADVSNPAKQPDMCIPWSVRVMEEFFMQVRAPRRRAALCRARPHSRGCLRLARELLSQESARTRPRRSASAVRAPADLTYPRASTLAAPCEPSAPRRRPRARARAGRQGEVGGQAAVPFHGPRVDPHLEMPDGLFDDHRRAEL
jgi:hypothetical protein